MPQQENFISPNFNFNSFFPLGKIYSSTSESSDAPPTPKHTENGSEKSFLAPTPPTVHGMEEESEDIEKQIANMEKVQEKITSNDTIKLDNTATKNPIAMEEDVNLTSNLTKDVIISITRLPTDPNIEAITLDVHKLDVHDVLDQPGPSGNMTNTRENSPKRTHSWDTDDEASIVVSNDQSTSTPAKRARRTVQKRDTPNEKQLELIEQVFNAKEHPPIVLYEKKVRGGDCLYRLLKVPQKSPIYPLSDEKWFACASPTEIPTLYRKLVDKWLTLTQGTTTYHLGISK